MKEYDYTLLKQRVIEKYKAIYKLADILFVCGQSISNKLNNRSRFTYEEIEFLIRDLNIQPDEIMDYFFKEKEKE